MFAKCSNLNNNSFMTYSGILVSLTFMENKILGLRSSTDLTEEGKLLIVGDIRVCSDVVLHYFWCGFVVTFILTCSIVVLLD